MADPYFFGYGSLVNSATHGFYNPRRAQLSGWRRVWRHTDLRPVAILTVVRDADTQIDGMIAHVPDADWEALDQREWAYDRIEATQDVQHPVAQDIDIAVYAVPEPKHGAPASGFPIYLSYLDVVVQGYLREFGAKGAARFFATTDGWEAPMLNDRAAPRYPRHQQLTPDETAYVDEQLATLGVEVTAAQ